MNKKLIITEEQYRNLKFFLLETTFFNMAEKVMEKDDVVTITTNGKKLNFKVITKYGSEIYMDNIDKDSEYFGKRIFLNRMSFENNNLAIQVAKDDEQKNENPPKGNTWQKMTLKNVEDISVSRDGKVIDGTNYNPSSEKNEKLKNRFIESISTLGDGDAISLETDGKIGNVVLNFMNKNSDSVNFELSEETKDDLGNPNISSVAISLDTKNIEVTKNGLLNLNVLTYETNEEGNIQKKQSKIKNISDFSVTNIEDKPEEEKPEEEEEDDLDGQKIFNIITGDTQLRNAFYKKPSFWRSFTAELKGEKPKTTGYTVVKNLVDRYMDDSAEKKLGKNFLRDKDIKFRPLENIIIRYGDNKDYRIARLEEIDNVRYIGSKPSEEGSNYNILLSNQDIDVLVKEKTEKQNVYLCDVIRKYKQIVKDDEGKEKKIKKYSKPAKDISIEFIDSLGYRVDKEEVKK